MRKKSCGHEARSSHMAKRCSCSMSLRINSSPAPKRLLSKTTTPTSWTSKPTAASVACSYIYCYVIIYSGAGSVFVIKSAYKYRSDGDTVRFDDNIELHHVSRSEPCRMIHLADEPVHSHRLSHQYTEMSFEVNLSETKQPARLVILPYRDHIDQAAADVSIAPRGGAVYGGSIVFCLHKEIDSMLALLNTLVHFKYVNPQQIEAGDGVDSNGLWKIESATLGWSGQAVRLRVNAKSRSHYRMKHVATGSYLCVSPHISSYLPASLYICEMCGYRVVSLCEPQR